MKRRPSGQVLMVVLIVMILVGAAAVLVAASLRLRNRLSQQEIHRVRLVSLNDAALAEALAYLDENPGFSGLAEHSFDRGIISSHVTHRSRDRVVILAVARLGPRKRAVEAEVELGGRHPRVVGWRRLPGPG